MKNTCRILITLLATVILSCNQSDPALAPAITKFSPPFASRGSSVTIEGANFSTDPLANEIGSMERKLS